MKIGLHGILRFGLVLLMVAGSFGLKAQPGNGLHFDGAGDYVSVPYKSSLDVSSGGQLTMEMWLYPTGSGNIVTRQGYGYGLWNGGDGYIYFWDQSGQGSTIKSGLACTMNAWNHVAVTVQDVGSSLNIYFYINGKTSGVQTSGQAQINNGAASGSLDFGIQDRGSCNCNYYTGVIDEFRLWNVVRTQDQIKANMFGTISGATSGLVAYYRFDEGTAGGSNGGVTTAVDQTSSPSNGTLNNFALSGSTSNWVSSLAYYYWSGGISTWSTGGNWTPGAAPGSSDYVYLPSGANATITSSTSVKGVYIASGATLTINSSQSLSVSDLVINTGTITGAGEFVLNGSSAQTIYGTGTINNLTINNSSNVTLDAGNTTQTLTGNYTKTAGTLTTNGNLIISSTGRIGQVTSGSVSGNVTVEVAIPGGRRAFRLMGHPFSGSVALSSFIDDIHVTGTGGASNGFDATISNNPSAFTYAESGYNGSTNSGFSAFTNTSNTIAANQAIRILYRGPRSQSNLLDGTFPSPLAATIDYTGALNQGTVNFAMGYTGANGGNAGWNMIPNPYASNINVGNIASGNRNNIGTFSVWVPTNGTNGGYVSQSFGSSYIIPAGSAFFVKTSSATNFTFSETDKTSSAVSAALLKTDLNKLNALQIDVLSDDTIFWDKLEVRNREFAVEGIENIDAPKMTNPDVNFASVSASSELLAIDNRSFVGDKIIPLSFETSSDYHFDFKVSNLDMAGYEVYLNDKFLKTNVLLKLDSKYSFVTTSDALSKGAGRFELAFKASATGNNELADAAKSFIAFPNPAKEQITIALTNNKSGEYQVSLMNSLGQVVETSTVFFGANSNYSIHTGKLGSGIYFIVMRNEHGTESIRFVK